MSFHHANLVNSVSLSTKLRVFIISVFFAAVFFCPYAVSQQLDLKQVAASLARDINSANRHTITVADFTDLQGNVTELGRFIAEELSTQLVGAKSFSVVERIQLAAILKEHQISISGLVEPATIRKLGQFAGVDAIVTGTLVPFSDSVKLTAKVLDVSTAKVIAVSSSDLARTKAVDDLLSRGISSPGTVEPPRQSGSASQVRPVQAASLMQNECLFVIKSCIRRGERLQCSGSVTNKADKARNFTIGGGQSWSIAVDNIGNSYPSDQVAIGQIGGPNSAQLMPDLPVNFFIQFPAVDQAAAQVNLILGYSGDGMQPYPAKALFRNIPLTLK
ncbi:MAG TPA: FlgO family outer membrane protein [Candidatus Angelobacter sp.]|jgi:TolB-like protein